MKYVLVSILVFTLFESCDLRNYEKIKLQNGNIEVMKRVQINDSLTCLYYDNGNLYQETHYKIGQLGYEEKEVLHYHKSGQLEKYSIYVDSRLRFYKFYGNESSYGGSPLFYHDLDGEYFDTIEVKSTIRIDFKIATPPHCIPHIMYGVYVENDRERDMTKDPVYELEIVDGKTAMVESFRKKGNYRRTVYWSIEDTLINDFYNGKNIMNINVIENN
ncbi:hypothetical protein [Carboxylicivirga taeanensis]|uniref:hypothetical protein n=1 Tax=Carboxylicivirga taeanensis TaxID=1416875 RepID=UPI003F6E080A